MVDQESCLVAIDESNLPHTLIYHPQPNRIPGKHTNMGITADLLVMRVALVVMSVVSVFSILILIPGLRCTTLIPSELAQGRMLQISGALCLFGGLYCSC
ncbi:hypothetical protein D9C73_005499 [Collichthys lucidus]|uniref:Uncharacterized protein n=1 Tax=Collichthys lucidus TaxID=240159 RepID=A0A4U5UAX6_COLLU|nr:hypothetical protein D9C73_005499 [Collichthys lucidus]